MSNYRRSIIMFIILTVFSSQPITKKEKFDIYLELTIP